MKYRTFMWIVSFVLSAVLVGSGAAVAQEQKSIDLPKPTMQGGKPLMQALQERSTARAFSKEKLPLPVLSNLLWAAFGVNRPEKGGRTAPSTKNWQEVDVYVALEEGLYLYDAKKHALEPVVKEDLRALTGTQAFVGEAPVNLIYVSDLARTGSSSSEEREIYLGADVGFIGQNVYLFCASEGLSTVVRGSIDRKALAKAMKLRPDQRIILAQTVGFPKK